MISHVNKLFLWDFLANTDYPCTLHMLFLDRHWLFMYTVNPNPVRITEISLFVRGENCILFLVYFTNFQKTYWPWKLTQMDMKCGKLTSHLVRFTKVKRSTNWKLDLTFGILYQNSENKLTLNIDTNR